VPISRSSLERFVKKLPCLLLESDIKIEKINFQGKSENNWDTPARQVMMDKFSSWLKQELGLTQLEIEDALFVEGIFGKLSSEVRGDFFGSVCCPDMALQDKDGFKIAIEIDHGKSGYQLRNALAKASFNVTSGRFDRSLVLFFVEYKDKIKREAKFNSNHDVLRRFEKEFSTKVLFVTNYQPMP
jgi:hypothetical protein